MKKTYIPPARSASQAKKEFIVAKMCKSRIGATTEAILNATGWRTCHHEAMPRIAHIAAGEGYILKIDGVEGTPSCRYWLVKKPKPKTKPWHPPVTMIAICE